MERVLKARVRSRGREWAEAGWVDIVVVEGILEIRLRRSYGCLGLGCFACWVVVVGRY
jgi:hypothetical protein